jgi:NADH dehydrogenase
MAPLFEMASGERPRVVIVGGGFAGLNAAKALRRVDVDVTVVDRSNHHLFQPLLYQVAGAALNPSDIATPIRRILRGQANATVLLSEVTRVDAENKCVITADGSISYEFLILACGATHSYFGNDRWSRYAPGLKDLDDAVAIRNRMLFAFEAAEREADAALRNTWMTFVIIGGGPTGVELAGSFAEIARHTLARDFRRIDPNDTRVILLEGGKRVLPTYSEQSSRSARHQLESLGVTVREAALVTDIDATGVCIGEERIAAGTVLWAAGVAASPLGRSLRGPLDRAGRVGVESDLSLADHPEVFVAGDMCAFEQDGRPVPGVAPAAIQAGVHAAKNVERRVRGLPTVPFRYSDKGSLATIGRAAAVAEVASLRLSGWVAWVAWLAVHIFFLIGFRNRFLVLFEWAWAYVTYQRGVRLITGDVARWVRRSEG